MSLKTGEAKQIAKRMLADYDVQRPNEIFAGRGTDWLTLEDAYAIQAAVAELRVARGDRCIGYKVGCVSKTIQEQLGLSQFVRGYLWKSELLISGSRVPYAPREGCAGNRFVNLAIEGEIAIQLSANFSSEKVDELTLSQCIECWFPVIELHNAVFRGPKPTSQELVAGNAMHAGVVVPFRSGDIRLKELAAAEIRIEMDGKVVETKAVTEHTGGPLASLRRLASMRAPSLGTLKGGDIVLTGSPGRLIPIEGPCEIAVVCQGQRVELQVQNHADHGS